MQRSYEKKQRKTRGPACEDIPKKKKLAQASTCTDRGSTASATTCTENTGTQTHALVPTYALTEAAEQSKRELVCAVSSYLCMKP